MTFNEKYRYRTKDLAIKIIKWYGKISKTDEIRIIGRQLIKSTTSTAANFRAYCRGRSDKERYSKLSIVVEEADETLFWIELLLEIVQDENGELNTFKVEALELVKVFATLRKNK